MTKALTADDITFTVVIYRDSSFFNELKRGWKHLLDLMFIFNEHELCTKTARILRLFFNEHELCAKTARLYQS